MWGYRERGMRDGLEGERGEGWLDRERGVRGG